MAVKTEEILKIVSRVRRLGWDVEQANGRQDWVYRITCPDKYRIQIHGTPSDRNWLKSLIKDLNAHGFAEAEAAYELATEQARQQRLEEDRKRNDEILKATEEKAKREAFTRVVAGPYVAQVVDEDWFFKPHPVPETRRALISPELAQKILDVLNTGNRPIRKARVAFWADQMNSGNFVYTHQGIAINHKPQLQDGQHRLAASVLANYTLDVNVSVGMPETNFAVIDSGASRTASDALAVIGKVNTNVLAGTVRLVILYDIAGPELRLRSKSRIPHKQMVEGTQKYGEEIEECVRQAQNILSRVSATRSMSRISLAAGLYLIGRKVKKDDPRFTDFVNDFRDGVNLPYGDVRWHLRNFMDNIGQGRRHRRVSTEEQLGVFIKAWNAWASGRVVKQLAFRGNELFPSVFVPPPLDD